MSVCGAWCGLLTRRSERSFIPTNNWLSATRCCFLPTPQSGDGIWFMYSRVMVATMFLIGCYLQILRAVVSLVPVLVVDYFVRFKLSANNLLHDVAMLFHVATTANPNAVIAKVIGNFKRLSASCLASARESAKLSRLILPKFKRPNLETFPARFAVNEQIGPRWVSFSHFYILPQTAIWTGVSK